MDMRRGLPRLGAPLPTREAQPAYWAHLDGLMRTSGELAKLALEAEVMKAMNKEVRPKRLEAVERSGWCVRNID